MHRIYSKGILRRMWQGVRRAGAHRAFLLPLALTLGACSMFDAAPETGSLGAHSDEADSWYNQGVLKNIFGDFERTPVLVFRDSPANRELIPRGKYLVENVAACGACHATSAGDPSSALAGGRVMQDRFGKVIAANITPDRGTGIGEWNPLEVMRAIRGSIDREGRPLSIDLHESYRWMSDQDAKAISLYLMTLRPVKHSFPRRTLGGFERNKWGLFPQHREVAGYVPALPEAVSAERGRYLSHHVAQCRSCHSGAGESFGGYGRKGGVVELFQSVVTLLTPEQERYDESVANYLSPEGRRQYQLEMAREQAEREGKAFDGTMPDEKVEIAELYSSALDEGRFPVAGPDIRVSASLTDWSDDDIVQYLSTGRSRSGETREARFCPWPYYGGMKESDKRSIAQYLRTL
ncbi:MAG: hypothetical protein IT290_01305 [Deltaproteobacteria bacterium]|nr:hypothetical protein [Deltaproteobacteria bacterium]